MVQFRFSSVLIFSGIIFLSFTPQKKPLRRGAFDRFLFRYTLKRHKPLAGFKKPKVKI
ncbi:hypothetical protein CHISP_0470 [Chitinispirillum alkaliphilum]|nr:hypothetical protein CHISP_0470 [Chitinispirillum alkaliphilum]